MPEIWFILARSAIIVVSAMMLAKLAQIILIKLLARTHHVITPKLAKPLSQRLRWPLLMLFCLIAVNATVPFISLPDIWQERVSAFIKPLIVGSMGWLVIGIVRGIADWRRQIYSGEALKELSARRATTQLTVLVRVAVIVIGVLTAIGMVLVIPSLRTLGMSLFASAGVAGIVLGVAAKETLSNIIAGIQLALAQPILIGDSVMIDGTTGTVEEITSSYVVLRTWDLRRKIVPLNNFMQNSFENYTYQDPAMYGPIYLYLDYTAKIPPIRSEARRIASSTSQWNGKRCEVIVTDSKPDVIELRVSISADDSPTLWDLQCIMREQLIAFIQRTQPTSLPMQRQQSWDMTTEQKSSLTAA